jgi:hypothetical protein
MEVAIFISYLTRYIIRDLKDYKGERSRCRLRQWGMVMVCVPGCVYKCNVRGPKLLAGALTRP